METDILEVALALYDRSPPLLITLLIGLVKLLDRRESKRYESTCERLDAIEKVLSIPPPPLVPRDAKRTDETPTFAS